MKRAQSMAQAAWTRPSLGRLSSWSCMGPRHRPNSSLPNSTDEGTSSDPSSAKSETYEPLLSPPHHHPETTIEAIDLPVSSSGELLDWHSDETGPHIDLDDGDDPTVHNVPEDRMTEVELWQQLEHELYDLSEGEEADVAKEIREEEEAVIGESESSVQEMKEVHRFFPAGKVMHIITLHVDYSEHEGENDNNENGNDNATSGDTENRKQPEEGKIGIFLTPRSLYSKLRLSQTMISDHFMPVYRRQIEKLIRELEKDGDRSEDSSVVVL